MSNTNESFTLRHVSEPNTRHSTFQEGLSRSTTAMTLLERQRFQVTRFYYERFRTTVINDIWPEMLFFTLISVMVVLVSELTHASLAVSNVMLTVLGTILGLVISFRTTTAYERFSEGRKLWTTLAMGSRNLAQIIWIHVPFESDDPPEDRNEKKSNLRVVIEKKSMISLALRICQFFPAGNMRGK